MTDRLTKDLPTILQEAVPEPPRLVSASWQMDGKINRPIIAGGRRKHATSNLRAVRRTERRRGVGAAAGASLVAIAALIAICLAVVLRNGHGRSDSAASPGSPASASPTADPSVLTGHNWVLQRIEDPSGSVASKPDGPEILDFTPSGRAFDNTNSGNEARIDGNVIRFGQTWINGTMAVGPHLDVTQYNFVIDVLRGDVIWTANDGVLQLSRNGVGTLVFSAQS